MAILSKKYDITFPLDAQQAENIDEMFLDLYRQLGTSVLGGDLDPGSVIIVDEEGDFSELGLGTEGSFLRSGATAPAWSDLLLPNDAAQGDLLYASAADTIITLPKNTSATRYLSNTGVSNNPAWAQVDLTNGVTGILPPGSGGTGSSTLLTQGSVVFAGVGGVFSEDNANFFWDDANNRLGLGLATPGYKLDVRHTSSASQAHIGSDSADEGGYLTAFNAFDSFVVSRAAFNGSNWIAKAATAELIALDAGSVQFSVNSGLTPGVSFTPTERVRINATGLGVHTTPGHAFDVNIDPGTVGTVVFAGLGDLVGTNPLFYLQGSDGTAAIRSRNAHPLAFWTNDVERARITTAGLLAFGGGGTSSYPALKRNTTTLEVRLADDSGFADFSLGTLTTTGSATIGGAINGSSHVRAGAAGYIYWDGRSSLTSPSDGVITLRNAADTSFTKLQFGGSTASFPALRRSSAVLDVVLADESAYGTFNAGAYNVGGVAGVSFGPGAVASITVVNGIVTAIS